MDGGGHGRTEERAAEKLMDDYLKSLGLARKKIAKDGSCLFRAVAEQVLHCQSLHSKVRAECVKFLKLNREVYEAFIEGDFEDYVLKLRDPQQWVGEVEINALAAMYKRDFLIFQEPGKPAVNITDNNYEDKVQLCFLNGNHYDSVYPIKRIKNAAVCQSILYEMLYDKVFKVERGALSLCQRTGRPHDLLSDDNMPACPSSDESDLETGDALWVENGTSSSSTRHQSHRGRGRGRQLPERVRRSLNPTLFRNIDYDVWHKTKRAQQKLDFCIAAGMQFTVGDRCQVRLEGSGRSYNATIKEVPPNDNQVVVFIEELGRRNVPLWWLSPLSDDSSWSAVVNKDKRLSNGHGEWEEKGKGRGRGKHAAAATTTATASAAGSSGRVQKQRSVEEQGGSKPSRKSMSSMETTAFGLTEEERLAKKEEELNVALVEIQLRDENSFPALGTQTAAQGDGGKKKGGEKKKLQRNKTKSPVEDVRAASPSAGERPKSSSPPHVSAAATTSTTTAAAAAPVDPAPAWLSSIKAPAPNVNMAASGSTSTRAATTPKTSASSYTSAAGTATSSPPPVVQSVPASANIFSLLTPALPAASSPPTPPASSSSSSSSPSKSTVSPPPSSSVPPPTFIAPIAPSPCLLPLSSSSSSSLPRSSPPVSSLLHSPSPSITSSTSSSSLIHHAAQIQEAPPAAAQTTSVPKSGASVMTQTSQNQISASQTQTQTSHNQVDVQTPVVNIQTQNQVSLAQTQVLMPQMQTEAQASVPQAQHQSQSLTDVALPQNQIQGSIIQPQSQVHYPSQQPQMVHTPPGVYYPPTQAPAPVQPHPQPQSLPTHPPHPSQPPPPSHPVSTSPAHPPLQSQTPNTQNQTEAPQTPHPPSQHHLPAGGVPLEKLCQLYQDPLYPGFPQGEKGDIVPNPPFSLNKSGEDLPRDVNILRFFFNLGVKAYTMPLYPPYLYLLPLQQTYTVNPRPPSPSPSCSPAPATHFPPPNTPIRHQEAYAPYHPTPASLPPQFDHQAPLPEPPRPSEPSFDQGRGHVPQPPPPRMSWQQHRQMAPHRNPSYPTGFPSGPLPYPVPPPSSQVYHPGQGPAHPPPSQQPYPPTLSPPYPPASMGYPPSSHPEELQVSQGGVMEQLQHTNGDTMAGHGLGRVPGALEGPAANMANANNKRLVVANNFAMKEQGDGSTRAVLLIDPPLNKEQIDALVSSVDMSASMKPGGAPSSSSPYRFPHKMSGDVYQAQHHKLYKQHKPYAKTTEGMSVGCSTEDDWEETEGFKPTTLTYRGSKRGHRGGGGRGRGGSGNYEGGRGRHRRPQEGFNHNQFSPSQRGRGW